MNRRNFVSSIGALPVAWLVTPGTQGTPHSHPPLEKAPWDLFLDWYDTAPVSVRSFIASVALYHAPRYYRQWEQPSAEMEAEFRTWFAAESRPGKSEAKLILVRELIDEALSSSERNNYLDIERYHAVVTERVVPTSAPRPACIPWTEARDRWFSREALRQWTTQEIKASMARMEARQREQTQAAQEIQDELASMPARHSLE